MSKFSLVIIIILLSVAVTVISGILLPTYLSRRILELRKELNSPNRDSKYSLQANIVPVSERYNQNNFVTSRNVETQDFSIPVANSAKSLEKAKTRSKRQVMSDNDFVSWNFNFNLTEHRNHALKESSEVSSGTPKKIKPLGISIFTEGEAKRKTAFSEIQYSLKAVEYFFKYLFHAGNYTHEETEAVQSETDFPKLDAGSSVEPPIKGREGKFFNLGSLNIFGFRRTPEKIPSTSQIATESVFERDELVTTEFPQMDIFTGHSQEITNLSSFQEQSFITEKPNLENVSNVSDLNLPGKTEDGECIDCAAESLETQISSNTVNQTHDIPVTETTSTEFSDEFLEMFCMSLVNQVGVSQHLSDSEDININPKETIDELDVGSTPENQLFDILPTLISEKDLPELVAEDSDTSDKSVSESDRQKKFLSLSSFFGFGSGRSAADETNELTSEAFANPVDLGNLPTLIDCKNYFRKKNIKMFSKPNLIDILSDPKIEFADFANATISSKLIEQQLHFLTGLIKTTLGNTVETFGKNSDGAITKSVFDATSENDKATLNEMLLTESNDLFENTKFSIADTDVKEDLTTELQRDGRFINIFGFGSGGGDQRSHETIFGTDKNEEFGSGDFRSFEAVDFGSGSERLLRNEDSNEKIGSGDSRSLGAALFGGGRDELGSGSLRSLEDAILDIDRNEEFGSGDSRSFGETAFVTEKNDLGSADFRSIGTEISGNDRKEFGSGESRSLEVISFGTEISEFGSGDSFKETSNLHDVELNSTNQPRFWGIFGLAGSGDGRDLPEDKEIFQSEKESGCDGDCLKTTEENNETFGEFKKPISSEDHTQDCQGCNNEDSSNLNRNKTLTDVSECEKCNSSISISNIQQQNLQTEEYLVIDINQEERGKMFETSINSTNSENNEITDKENALSEIRIGTENPQKQSESNNTSRFFGSIFLTGSGDGGVFRDSGEPIKLLESTKDDNADGETINSKVQIITENTLDGQTEKNAQRFLRPVFLTGSGDGGLFEDNGGPINLVEETTVKSQNFSLRSARLDDQFEYRDTVHEYRDTEHETTVQKSNEERPIKANTTTEKLNSSVTASPTRRRGRMDDDIDEHCNDCDYEAFIENYFKNQKPDNDKSENITDHDDNEDANKFKKRINTLSVEENSSTNINKVPVTVSTDVIQSKPISFYSTKSVFQTRSCKAARECNVTLNERCISINSLRVCGCSKGYARSIETGKCVVKKIVQTTIKLPSERFEEDLKNSSSPSFQQKRKSSIELLILLLQNDPEMLRVLSEIDEIKFSSGSLVITVNLVFAAENKSEAELVKRLEDNLQLALRNETLIKNVSFNVSDASLVSVNGEIDYCKSTELNYCSENAVCFSNLALPEGYACQCKEHYRDSSIDLRHFGETCIAKCPKGYCGSYGHCEVLEDDRKVCLCNGLYFGSRCEVPGLYVLIMLGCTGFVSLTVLFVVVFKRKCSRFSYSESQAGGSDEDAVNSHVNGKVSDAIALEENIGTARFMTISTPLPHPAIKVTRPTITESGSSYDFDSTFDDSNNQTPLKTEEDTTV